MENLQWHNNIPDGVTRCVSPCINAVVICCVSLAAVSACRITLPNHAMQYHIKSCCGKPACQYAAKKPNTLHAYWKFPPQSTLFPQLFNWLKQPTLTSLHYGYIWRRTQSTSLLSPDKWTRHQHMGPS